MPPNDLRPSRPGGRPPEPEEAPGTGEVADRYDSIRRAEDLGLTDDEVTVGVTREPAGKRESRPPPQEPAIC